MGDVTVTHFYCRKGNMSGQYAKQLFNDFNPIKEEQDAKAIVQLTFEQLGLPDLHKVTAIEFNNRFQNRAGDAKLTQGYNYDSVTKTGGFNRYVGKIRLSSKYFAVVSEAEKMETIVHEACHIANDYLRYTNADWRNNVYNFKQEKQTDGHGPGWERLMNNLGYKANRYHCTSVVQFKSYYAWKCKNCDKTGMVSAQLGGRMINQGQVRLCPNHKKCGGRIFPGELIKVSGADIAYADAIIKGK